MAIVAFAAGVVAAVIVVLIVLLVRDGNEDGEQQARPNATVETTPAATRTSSITPPGPTATAIRAGDPDEALAAFLQAEFQAEHLGACSDLIDPATTPVGLCSAELYRSGELVTLLIGAPFSEFFGEAVITPDADGLWSVEFVQAPPLGEPALHSLGAEAVVFGAGSCLNFREAPSLSGERLTCQIDGARGQVVEGPVEADGITWWRLEDLGWATGEFLAPAAE